MSFGGGSAIPVAVVTAATGISAPALHNVTIPLDVTPPPGIGSVVTTVSNTGGVPDTLTITSGNGSGFYEFVLVGTVLQIRIILAPTTSGTDTLGVRASNTVGTSNAVVTINRLQAPVLSDINFNVVVPNPPTTPPLGTVPNTGGTPTSESFTVGSGTSLSDYSITTGGVVSVTSQGTTDLQTVGTDTLTASASNASGTSTAQVTIQRASVAPVINDINFQLPLVAPSGTQVGTVQSAIGFNITYTILTENGAAPTGRYNLAPTTGILTVTASGSAAFQSDGRDTLVVRAANANGADNATVNVIKLVTIVNGQQMLFTNTGRAGAQAAQTLGFSTTLTTITTPQIYNGNFTIRNTRFTNQVNVTGGTVLFEFCQFAYAPPAADHALQIYNAGNATGTVTCNWCDIDSGLRGTQGNFETCGFQAGERGIIGVNNPTFTGSFLLYRCEIQGFGNGCGFHKWQGQLSTVRECYVNNLTSGGGSHGDGFEIYTSDNLTIERCRVQVLSDGTAQSCFQPANQDFGNTVNSRPIIIQNNYVDGGIGPFSFFFGGPAGSGTHVRNVKLISNWFGDSSQYGREYDMGGDSSITPGSMLNMSYDLAYWNANQAANTPGIIYVALDNKWAPNGEGVDDPSASPSGDFPNGKPHIPGQFVGAANVFGGNTFSWNGSLLGPGTPPVVALAPTTITLPASGKLANGQLIRQYTATNAPVVWRAPGNYFDGQLITNTSDILTDNSSNDLIASGVADIAGLKYVTIDNSGRLTVTSLGAQNLTAGTYTIDIQAINGSGPGTTTETITIGALGAAPVVNPAGPFTLAANPPSDFDIGNITATNTPITGWAITAASDPNNNFAIYLRPDSSGELRVSDGTVGGGGGGPPPPSGTYNLAIQATNTNGTSVARTITVTVQTSSIAPVIADTSFPLTLNAGGVGAPATTVVGNITASAGSTPITWTITAGNAQGWWTITGSGLTAQITVTLAGSSTSTGITTGTWPLTIRASNAFGQSIATANVVASTASTSIWPDATNTGYTNAPGFNTAGINPTPGQLTAMSTSAIVSGQTYSFKSFDAAGGHDVGAPNVTFIGCRFSSNATDNYNVRVAAGAAGGTTSFYYCSFTPRPSLVTQPPQGHYSTPGFHWPSNGGPQGGGSGGSQDPNKATVQINGTLCYGYGIQPEPDVNSGNVVMDHCDMWGFSNGLDLHHRNSTNRMIMTNTWMHDARLDNLGDHTDGPGDIAGNNGTMSYMIFVHNTIASIGQTQGFAMQGDGPYPKCVVLNNYLSGFGYTNRWYNVLPGQSNIFMNDNVYGTDVQWDNGLCNLEDKTNFGLGGVSATASTNQWRRNTLHVKPGTSHNVNAVNDAWTPADDGKFCWLERAGTYHTTDLVDAYSASNPVTTARSLSRARPAPSGTVIGTLTATNTPTSWEILSASPPWAGTPFTVPWFNLANNGDLKVTAAGASAITAGVYTLTVVAVNAAGTWSAPVLITITIT